MSLTPVDVMSNITKFSSNIIFYWYEISIQTHGIDVTYTSNPSWDLGNDGRTLILDGITPFVHKDGFEQFPFIALTFTKISPNLIELKDPHQDVIKLTR
jgi:hypothetical protein